MTLDPSPILDYASPRSRVKIRLPSNSVIRFAEENGELRITETLTGQREAIFALCFAAIVLCVMIAIDASAGASTLPHELLIFTFCEMAALISVGLLVVRNSWRKTQIRVVGGYLSVLFTAPLSPARRFSWHVGALGPTQLRPTDGQMELGELRIIPDFGPEVHLFTDHRMSELLLIHAAIQRAIDLYNACPVQASERP